LLVSELGLSSIGDIRGVEISGITVMTSEIGPGDLFVAVRGAHRHGAEFAADARTNGAAAILTDAEGAELAADATIPTNLSGTAWHVLGSLLDAHARGGDSRVLSVVTGLAGSASRARSLAYIVYAIADRRGRSADSMAVDQFIRAWPVQAGSTT
jgi:UDP-N-acetylmuramoyl-L-alanyl-D-glutamate--2,6-diaminopimelate ligase